MEADAKSNRNDVPGVAPSIAADCEKAAGTDPHQVAGEAPVPPRCIHDVTPRWKRVLEVAGIVVTFLVAVIYSFQLREMIEQNRQSRRALKMDQRAWLGIVTVNNLVGPGRRTIGQLTIINSGKTPAKNATAHIGFQALGKGESPDFTLEDLDPDEHRSLITPGTTFQLDLPAPTNDGQGIDAPGWTLVQSGTRIIWLHGRISYEDIFNCHHKLEFCYYYSALNQRLMTCRDHNNTDSDEC